MEYNNESFQYTYSAKEQAEIEHIRKKYLPKEENKMEQLRKLDEQPNRKARTWAIVLGVIGCLIMGTGMSIFMTDLGAALGSLAMAIGIVVGIPGLAMIVAAYPVHNWVLRKEREKIAPEILRLTDELMK